MNRFKLESFSQEGEDILLKRIFEYRDIQQGGFYVDIGAHHPQRFSNTYFFYKRNWKGINIDATPGSMELFNNLRDKDINLELAISDKKETLTYYMFNEPALNSFDKKLSYERNKLDAFSIIKKEKINTYTLEEILTKYIPANQDIDFISIDVEGFDHNVLISNNWKKYRPKVVLVETLSTNIEEMLNNKTFNFLKDKNYIYYAKTVGTHIFLENTFYKNRFNK